MKVLALDFDGVICDSAQECYIPGADGMTHVTVHGSNSETTQATEAGTTNDVSPEVSSKREQDTG